MNFITISLLSVFLFLTSCKDSDKKFKPNNLQAENKKEEKAIIPEKGTEEWIQECEKAYQNWQAMENKVQDHTVKTEKALQNYENEKALVEQLTLEKNQASPEQTNELDRKIQASLEKQSTLIEQLNELDRQLQATKRERTQIRKIYEKFAPFFFSPTRLRKFLNDETYCEEDQEEKEEETN